MKIGLSTCVVDRGRSGVGQYVLALVRALLPEAARHEFTLFVLDEDRPLFAFAAPAMRIVPVSERFRAPWRNVLWHQLWLPVLVRRFGLEVLHVPSYRRLLWLRPCALVATIHDLAPFRVRGKYDPLRMLYGRRVVPTLARRQGKIIAVSRVTAQDISDWLGVPPARVQVIHNGIDHVRFHPGPRREAQTIVAHRHGLRRPFLLYVARLEHPAKNHARLIAAFARFKAATGSPWQLILAGADWAGAEVVHDLAKRSEFASDIVRLGFVADADLPALYRAAELLVFPSLFEGFGLPPLEAMACGCPVLASHRGALAEVLGHATAVIDPENVADIAAQIGRLASDDAARAELRAAGLVHAAGFHWRRTATATLAAYMRAVRPRSP